jgi:hypothetical protein
MRNDTRTDRYKLHIWVNFIYFVLCEYTPSSTDPHINLSTINPTQNIRLPNSGRHDEEPTVCCVACNVHVYVEEIIQSCGTRNSLPPSLVYKWWPSTSWWTVIIRNEKDMRLPACAGQDMHQGFQKAARMPHAAMDWLPVMTRDAKYKLRAWTELILIYILRIHRDWVSKTTKNMLQDSCVPAETRTPGIQIT